MKNINNKIAVEINENLSSGAGLRPINGDGSLFTMKKKIINGKLTEGNTLSWIDMHFLDGTNMQIKLDDTRLEPGMIIDIWKTKFILTPERFLKQII